MFRPTPAALMLAAALALTACGGSDEESASPSTPPSAEASSTPSDPSSPTPTPGENQVVEPDDAQTISLSVAGGEVTGDIDRVEVPVGTSVRLSITSDVADEVHVHGYEITRAVSPGQALQIEFVADQPGVFEVELHDDRKVLTRLQVS